MSFLTGFLIWLAIGLVAGGLAYRTYRGAGTTALLSFIFGVFGALVGGMLGTSAYIFHNPAPLRPGGIIGAVAGGLFFTFLYHFMARKAV
ncbi:MAG: hypothetical protein HY703_01295 [Gemmatimonadetes bacterium]|nr:hypothetical protein [Gemmatimonadota bacterium]